MAPYIMATPPPGESGPRTAKAPPVTVRAATAPPKPKPKPITVQTFIARRRAEGHNAEVIAAMLNQRKVVSASGGKWRVADVKAVEASHPSTSAARTTTKPTSKRATTRR